MFGLDDLAFATIGSSLVGGLFNSNAQRSANDANARLNAENAALQREFAQKGVQWRVADAKAAGVHPVYALGAQGASYSPSAIPVQADTSIGDAFNNMGQGLLRYGMSRKSPEEQLLIRGQIAEVNSRADAASAEAQLARTRAADIARGWNEQPGLGVGVGIEGRDGAISYPIPERRGPMGVPLGTAGRVRLKPAEQTSESRFDPSRNAGVKPAWDLYRTKDGSYMYMPSQDLSNAWQDMPWWGGPIVAWKNAERYVQKWLPHVYVQHGSKGQLPKYRGYNFYDPAFGTQ